MIKLYRRLNNSFKTLKGVYDNGYKVIGTIKDIKKWTSKLYKKVKFDDINYDLYIEILELIKDLEEDNCNKNDILVIDYDMEIGFNYDIWHVKDKVY